MSSCTYPTAAESRPAIFQLRTWTVNLEAQGRSSRWIPAHDYSLIGGEQDARSEACYVLPEDHGLSTVEIVQRSFHLFEFPKPTNHLNTLCS